MSAFSKQFGPEVLLPSLERKLAAFGKESYSVLHLATGNLFGGIEKILLTLQKNKALMPRINQRFALMFPGRLHRELVENDAELDFLCPVRFRYPWQIFRARNLMRKLLLSRCVDTVVVHSTWTYAIFSAVIKSCGVRLVLWLHDAPKGSGIIEWYSKRTKPDLVLANSKYTASSVSLLFSNMEAEIAYPVIEMPKKQNFENRRQTLRTILGCQDTTRVVLVASRFDPYKGHYLLFNALATLSGKGMWECWVAGSIQNNQERILVEKLKTIAVKQGFSDRIRWLGHCSNMENYYAAADVFCQPNQGPEPFGMVFIEAQAMGCPVITTAMGGALEAVEDNGINTLLVKPCPDLLAQALEKHLLMPCRYAIP